MIAWKLATSPATANSARSLAQPVPKITREAVEDRLPGRAIGEGAAGNRRVDDQDQEAEADAA